MKLKLFACLFVLVGGLVCVSQAVAESKIGNPFLSVDINGNPGSNPNVGPLQPGFQPFEILITTDALNANFTNSGNWARKVGATPPTNFGITQTFATSEGNITAVIAGSSPANSYDARNRGTLDALVPAPVFLPLERDFIFAAAANDVGWGRAWIRTELSGLIPNQAYLVSFWGRDINFSGSTQTQGFQAYTDRAALGGLDGPAAWLDANTLTTGLVVGAGYDATDVAPAGYKNPIPTKARSNNTGPNIYEDAIHYAAIFKTSADATGKVTVYTWPDGDTFNGSNVQRAPVLNGFEIAKVPEPASVALFVVGLAGIAALRRRCR